MIITGIVLSIALIPLLMLFVPEQAFYRLIGFMCIPLSLGLLGSVLYILRFPAYRMIARKYYRLEDLYKQMKALDEAQYASAKVSDKNFNEELSEDLSDQTDYEYLHSLFFERYRKVFNKPARRRTLIILGLCLLLFVLSLFFRNTLKDQLDEILPGLFSGLFFLLYSASPSKRYIQLMFLNMDRDLLPYRWYRQKEAVLSCLKIRLRKFLLLQMPPTLCLLLGLFLILFVLEPSKVSIYLLLVLTGLIGAVFMTLDQLFIYYSFQYYDYNMHEKSTVPSITNLVFYALSYAQIYLKAGILGSLAVAFSFLLLSFAGLVLTLKRAPLHFKLKR